MEFNLIFNTILLVLLLVLLLSILRVFVLTIISNKKASESYMTLLKSFILEKEKQKQNNHKVLLLDNLNKSLFNRLFKITQKMISMQKLIFDRGII